VFRVIAIVSALVAVDAQLLAVRFDLRSNALCTLTVAVVQLLPLLREVVRLRIFTDAGAGAAPSNDVDVCAISATAASPIAAVNGHHRSTIVRPTLLCFLSCTCCCPASTSARLRGLSEKILRRRNSVISNRIQRLMCEECDRLFLFTANEETNVKERKEQSLKVSINTKASHPVMLLE
jgi:hypothetical protein